MIYFKQTRETIQQITYSAFYSTRIYEKVTRLNKGKIIILYLSRIPRYFPSDPSSQKYALQEKVVTN